MAVNQSFDTTAERGAGSLIRPLDGQIVHLMFHRTAGKTLAPGDQHFAGGIVNLMFDPRLDGRDVPRL